MEIIATNLAPKAIGPYSQAVISNRLVYTSGQIGLRPGESSLDAKDFSEQCKQVFKNLDEVLRAAGTSPTKVVKTTVFIASFADFPRLNELYAEFFGSHKPARSTVATLALPLGALIEIECVAQLD